MYLNYICCIFLVCCRFSQATLTANNVTGYGRETTLFTWSSLGIRPGDPYSITKDLNVIYFSIDEGIIKEGKYSAIAENGAITLTILNTNVSDVGVYECSHNFTRASGFLAVAFRPENVTAVATKLTDEWRMTVSATLVFPMDSAISSVTCSKADSSIAVFGTKSNAVSPNIDTSYLYDIAWNGTTPEILPEQTQCNITLNIIETVVRTIDVSFKGTSISTISTPNSTIGPSTTSSTTSATTISSTTTSTTTEPPLPSSTTSITALISTTSTPIDVRTSGSFLSTTTPSTTDSDQSRIIIISLSSSIGGIAMVILVCVVVCLLRNRISTKSTGRVPTSRHKQTDRHIERVFYEDDRNNMVHQQRSNSPYCFEDYRLYAPGSYSNSMQEWRYMNPNEYPHAPSGRTYRSQQTNINDRHNVPRNGGRGTEAIRNPVFNGYISRR